MQKIFAGLYTKKRRTFMRFLADPALFVEVANTRNFGRAAAALRMPPSTLARRISALERELGFHLIHRSSRTFTLTEAGKATPKRPYALNKPAPQYTAGLAVHATIPEHCRGHHVRQGVAPRAHVMVEACGALTLGPCGERGRRSVRVALDRVISVRRSRAIAERLIA